MYIATSVSSRESKRNADADSDYVGFEEHQRQRVDASERAARFIRN